MDEIKIALILWGTALLCLAVCFVVGWMDDKQGIALSLVCSVVAGSMAASLSKVWNE